MHYPFNSRIKIRRKINRFSPLLFKYLRKKRYNQIATYLMVNKLKRRIRVKKPLKARRLFRKVFLQFNLTKLYNYMYNMEVHFLMSKKKKLEYLDKLNLTYEDKMRLLRI